MSEDDASEGEPLRPVAIYPLLRWTIPIHALLPVLIAIVASLSERGADVAMGWVWLLVHIGFPIFLAATYPWWRGRGDEVALVVVINHAVTFAVGVLLISYW